MILPIGARVRMSEEGKEEYADYDNNPHNLTGFIIQYYDEGGPYEEGDYCYMVRWENGCTNEYRHCDLTPLPLVTKELEEYM
jgi:hypothetical protein